MAALLIEREAAAHMGVSLQTIRRWRRERSGPPFVKFEKAVRYRQEDLDLFIANAVIQTSPIRATGTDGGEA